MGKNMDKKLINYSIDNQNPKFITEIVFINGKRYEVLKGEDVEVPEIAEENINESRKVYSQFATSKRKITPDTGIRDSI